MIRLAVVAALSISVFVMMQGISATWRQEIVVGEVRSVAKDNVGKQEVVVKADVQPKMPMELPDFKAGYLFNAERKIEEEGAPPPEEEFVGNDLGLNAKVEDVTFSGALIGDTIKLALISFPAPPQKRKTSRSSKSRKPRRGRGEERARVKEGDVLNGYKVAAIYPDKIVFEKGAEIIEKFLYDPNKKRVAPSRNTRARGSARAVPPGGVPPLPPRAGVPGSLRPKARDVKKAIPRSATKRLVVTRKPPPKPDTSRVTRRRRATSSAIAPPVSSPSGTPFGGPHP